MTEAVMDRDLDIGRARGMRMGSPAAEELKTCWRRPATQAHA